MNRRWVYRYHEYGYTATEIAQRLRSTTEVVQAVITRENNRRTNVRIIGVILLILELVILVLLNFPEEIIGLLG